MGESVGLSTRSSEHLTEARASGRQRRGRITQSPCLSPEWAILCNRTFRNLSGCEGQQHFVAFEGLVAHDRVSRHTTLMPASPGAVGPCAWVRRSISVNPSRRGIPPLAVLA